MSDGYKLFRILVRMLHLDKDYRMICLPGYECKDSCINNGVLDATAQVLYIIIIVQKVEVVPVNFISVVTKVNIMAVREISFRE